MKIEDGTGNGFKVKVDASNRISAKSITTTVQLDSSQNGDSYQIGSGVVTLTNACESPVIFFENNENFDVIITGVNVTSNKMTSTTCCVFLAKVYSGACGICCGTSLCAFNNNFGSSQTLCATITSGGVCSTLTGGTLSGAFYIPVNTFFNTDLAWVIPKGSSVAISATPASGNTSFPVSIVLEGTLNRDS